MEKMKNGLRQGIKWLSILFAGLVLLTIIHLFKLDTILKANQPKTVKVATILEPTRPLVDFKLLDNKNELFTKNDLLGHWTILFFGFTHCPGICPTTMTELAKVSQEMKQMKATEPTYIMVSIDPQRDSPSRLNAYVKSFNPNFLGLTGSETEINKLMQDLNIVYIKTYNKQETSAEYEIEHSGTLMLVNPQGELAAFFSMPHQSNLIALDLIKIINQP